VHPDFDPYAAPTTAAPSEAPQALGMAVWQAFEAYEDGDKLTLSKHAALPDVCMRCGVEEPGMYRRLNHFSWIPSAAYFLICLGWIGVVIIAIALMKRATFYIPICAACRARWRHGHLVFGLLLLTVVLLFFAGVYGGLAAFGGEFALAALIGTFVVGLPAIVIAHRRALRPNIVWAARITNTHLTLRNVHPTARPRCRSAALASLGATRRPSLAVTPP
jgi:hypothetical protein